MSRQRRGTSVLPADVPLNVWLYTRTPNGKPYPCRCSQTRRCTTTGRSSYWCPDVGRTDTAHLPAWCGARRGEPAPETVVGFVDDEGGDE